jgi:hypothetical protein
MTRQRALPEVGDDLLDDRVGAVAFLGMGIVSGESSHAARSAGRRLNT